MRFGFYASVIATCLSLQTMHACAADVANAAPPPLSPFGIGADAHTGRDLTKWIPQMEAIGIHQMRSCDLSQMDYLTGHLGHIWSNQCRAWPAHAIR